MLCSLLASKAFCFSIVTQSFIPDVANQYLKIIALPILKYFLLEIIVAGTCERLGRSKSDFEIPHKSRFSYRGFLQIQINKVMFHYRGTIKKGHNSEKEHHLLIESFLKSTNTSLLSYGVILQLKTS